MEELLLKEEIWVKTTGDDAQAISISGDKMKMVAMIVNGIPVFLNKEYFMEKTYITKQEAKQLEEIVVNNYKK